MFYFDKMFTLKNMTEEHKEKLLSSIQFSLIINSDGRREKKATDRSNRCFHIQEPETGSFFTSALIKNLAFNNSSY